MGGRLARFSETLGRVIRGARPLTTDRAGTDDASRPLGFLAEASVALGASLDYETTLASVARLAVPFLADYCVVELVDDDGGLRLVAMTHVRPEQEQLARDIARYRSFPLVPDTPLPSFEPLSERRPAILREITDDMMRRLGVRSAMALPLVAHERTLGVLTLMRTESAHRYTEADLAVGADLATRCALAIDRASLYRAAQDEIGERTRTEQRLRDSDERLQLALQAAHTGTWDWNLETGEIRISWPVTEGRPTTFTATTEEVFGHVHPDDRTRVADTVVRVATEGLPLDLECRIVGRDGSIRWTATKGKVIHDASGKAVRILGVPVDITGRKHAEQRLAIQYATTSVLAEAATLEEAAPRILAAMCESLGWVHGALWCVDTAANVIRCVETWQANPEAVKEFDAASRAAAFPRGRGLPGRVWASGEAVWIPDVVKDANFPRAPVAAQEGLHAAFGFPLRVGGDVAGVIEFFSHQISPPDEELLAMISTVGKQIGQFMTRKRAEDERGQLLARERTARAEAEAAERRAAFLARASTALGASLDYPATLQTLAQLAVPTLAEWCTVDVYEPDGTLRRMATAHSDPATAAMLHGLLERYPPKDTVDHPLYRLLRTGRPEVVAEVPAAFLETMAHDRQHLELLRSLHTQAYMLVPIVVRGQTLGAIGFMSRERGRYGPADLELAEDLARRAAMAIDNARLYQEAQDATRRKDEFLAMLGHELRNPLAAIRAAVGVLEHPKTNPELAQRQREIIGRQSTKLARLVDDLLDVSRVMSGKIVLKRSPIALAAAVAACVETFRATAKSAEQQLVFRSLQSVTVDVDPLRVEQVVANLVDNAIKYTPAGGKIEVTVGRDGAEAVIRVRDTGMGIVKYMLPRIFDLFTQSDRALDRAQGGLGLGLTLVRRLVEQHGGRVAVSSAGPNKGSEFVVRLPAVAAKPVPRADAPAAPDPATPAPSRRVLLIEDNVDGRDAMRALLELWGHQVQIADDGAQGIEMARDTAPDVALVDIGLPGLDGYEVAAQLRAALGNRIRMVALTGYGQPDDRKRALDAGFDEHLVKPVEPERLARLLAELPAADAA